MTLRSRALLQNSVKGYRYSLRENRGELNTEIGIPAISGIPNFFFLAFLVGLWKGLQLKSVRKLENEEIVVLVRIVAVPKFVIAFEKKRVAEIIDIANGVAISLNAHGTIALAVIAAY
jgi:hypothetical protein